MEKEFEFRSVGLESQERGPEYVFARELADESSALLLDFSKKRNAPIWKGLTDFKTQADDAVATLVRERIGSRFPSHSIWSEEREPKEQDENWWYVDELDGTLRFTRGYSNRWGFSLGFRGKDLKFGLVSLPELGRVYESIEGKEAFCNGEQISVSNCSDINKALVAWDAGKGADRADVISVVNKLFAKDGVNYAPANGCASGALMSVAHGELDAYIATALQPEDMAGSVPIIRGAGGVVTTIDGKEWHPHCKSIVAANPQLHKELLKFLQAKT